ncbi:SHSP domain-containing protein [Abeliophyllum distichum]|uniref:SHSP domain-containing protein n=1 Tax=Abeliophyllum distichum TaxID=126358 RepID=A0ABD1VSB8_9LAMI
MANEGRIKPGIDKRESSLLFREIVPPHGWKEDENNHYLRLTLPGFQLIDVTLQIDKFGHLVVRGERQLSGHKFISFQETFDLPQNANVEESSGEFVDGEIYCVTIPKKQSSEYPKMKTPTQKSMGNPESKRDHAANDSNKKSTRKPDEFHDPEVPKPDNTTNGSNTITTDHEKSTTNMWFLLVMLVIVLIVIVVPTSLRFRK